MLVGATAASAEQSLTLSDGCSSESLDSSVRKSISRCSLTFSRTDSLGLAQSEGSYPSQSSLKPGTGISSPFPSFSKQLPSLVSTWYFPEVREGGGELHFSWNSAWNTNLSLSNPSVSYAVIASIPFTMGGKFGIIRACLICFTKLRFHWIHISQQRKVWLENSLTRSNLLGSVIKIPGQLSALSPEPEAWWSDATSAGTWHTGLWPVTFTLYGHSNLPLP